MSSFEEDLVRAFHSEQARTIPRSLDDVARLAMKRRRRRTVGLGLGLSVLMLSVVVIVPALQPAARDRVTTLGASTVPSAAPSDSASPSGSPEAPTGPFLETCAHPTTYKPTEVVLACGDGGVRAVNLVWTSWAPTEAEAKGVYVVRGCKPSCLAGTDESFSATFDFNRVVDGLFTQVKIHFEEAGPEGASDITRFV